MHKYSPEQRSKKTGNGLAVIWLGALAVFCMHVMPVTAEESADSYIEFTIDFGANCVARSAKQILVANNHPSRPVKIKLFRYFGEVRQPGRSAYTLESGQEPLALGCDKIQGRAQRWEMHKAEFVDVSS